MRHSDFMRGTGREISPDKRHPRAPLFIDPPGYGRHLRCAASARRLMKRAGLLTAMKYAQERGAVEFEPTDSASPEVALRAPTSTSVAG